MQCELLTPEGVPYIPLPAQSAWHASPALNRAYIGGFGSGKSLCGAVETLLLCLAPERKKGQQFLVCRYEYNALEDTTWKTLLDIIPDPIKEHCFITRGAGRLKIVLPNGVEILGRNLKNHQKFGSFNLFGAWIDECNEDGVDESFFLQLRGRMRDLRVPDGGVVLLTGNPGGRNWIFNRFFAWKEGKKKYESHEGFQAGTEENKYLPETYLRQLRETYPQEWLDRYFSGDFGVLEGQILSGFNPDIHLVAPFTIPYYWPRYRGLDPGINHPTACLWWTADLQGYNLIYKEYIKRGVPVSENAREILAASKDEEILWTVIDPAAEQRVSTGLVIQTTLQQYLEAGLHCQLGDNDVPASIRRLIQLLTPDPERLFPDWHHMAGQRGSPLLFISTACPYLKWEIEGWRWKTLKPGQIDRERVHAENDDAIAAARYICLRSPRQAELPAPQVNPHQRIMDVVKDLALERDRSGMGEWVGAERLGVG